MKFCVFSFNTFEDGSKKSVFDAVTCQSRNLDHFAMVLDIFYGWGIMVINKKSNNLKTLSLNHNTFEIL